MSEIREEGFEKRIVVPAVCEFLECVTPEKGEEAYNWIYNTYMEVKAYYRDNDTYPLQELIENEIPYNNYQVAIIWTQLGLYVQSGGYHDVEMPSVANRVKEDGFISAFQLMLYYLCEGIIAFEQQRLEDPDVKYYMLNNLYLRG